MRKPKRTLIRAGIIAGFFVSAGSAAAETAAPDSVLLGSWAKPGEMFMGTGVFAGQQHFPKFSSPYETRDGAFANPFRFTTRPKPAYFGPSGFMGYMFRPEDYPEWMGKRLRLAVGGRFWFGGLDQSTIPNPRPNHTRVGVASINGQFGTVGNFPGRLPEAVHFKLDVTGYELSMRLTSERTVSPRFTLVHFVVLWGGQSRERYRLKTRLHGDNDGTIVDSAAYRLDETVRSTRIGGAVGIRMAYRLNSWLTLGAGTQVGPYWIRSSLRGSDCYSNASTILPFGRSCATSPMPAGSFQTNVSDRRQTIGVRATISTSFNMELGFGTLTLSGFASFDSAVPGVNNPYVLDPAAGNATSGAARLRFGNGLNYGGMLMLRVPMSVFGG